MKSLPALFFSLLIIAITAGVWFLLEATRPETLAEVQDVTVLKVELVEVEQRDIQLKTSLTGRLLPAKKAGLQFEVSGSVVLREVEPGQKVIAGEELLRIETGDFEDAVSEAQVQLSQEEAAISRDRQLLNLVIQQRKLLQRDVARLEKLGKQSLASQSKTDEMKRSLLSQRFQEAELRHSVETAETRLKSRKLVLDRAQRNLDRTILKAPFNGTVNKIEVDIGDYVTPNQMVIELVQVDELELHVEASGEFVAGIIMGKTVDMTINNNGYPGRVISFQSDPDPSTHTHALKIRIAADQVSAGSLFPGQLGEVLLSGQAVPAARLIPNTAVLREKTQTYVFRFRSDYVEKLAVQVTGRYEDKLLINSGVEVGDQIVARHVAVLEDGQKVAVEKVDELNNLTQIQSSQNQITE